MEGSWHTEWTRSVCILIDAEPAVVDGQSLGTVGMNVEPKVYD